MSTVQQHVVKLQIKATVKRNGSPVDISSASVKRFILRPSQGKLPKTRDATFLTDGTDGVLVYETVDTSDLKESDNWLIQGYVELGNGFKGHTSIQQFSVAKNLESTE